MVDTRILVFGCSFLSCLYVPIETFVAVDDSRDRDWLMPCVVFIYLKMGVLPLHTVLLCYDINRCQHVLDLVILLDVLSYQ